MVTSWGVAGAGWAGWTAAADAGVAGCAGSALLGQDLQPVTETRTRRNAQTLVILAMVDVSITRKGFQVKLMVMNRYRLPILAVVLGIAGCAGLSPLDQLRQLKAFAKCEFRLASVEQARLSGMLIQGKSALTELSPLDALKLRGALVGGTLPLSFTLNVEAKNPNDEVAAMNRFAWTLFVDGRELVSGVLDRRVEIAPNGTVGTVPLAIDVDLRQALSGQTVDTMLNLAFNVAGAGTRPTRLTLKATPTIIIAGIPMEFPDAITVNTEFGGK
jgi:hypothetical protein